MDSVRSGWARWAIGALIVLGLVYISSDEIRAFPYDETVYILQAKAWYWGNGYNAWTYTRQPGFPLFVAVSALLGLPLRLAFEGLWIAAALLVARACAGAGMRPGGRVLLIALLLFHPFATELFTRALSDNLYTAAWLVLTASLASAVAGDQRRARFRWGILAVVSGAIAANCRQESVLVYLLGGAAGTLAVTAWGCEASGGRARRGDWRSRLAVGIALPVAAAFTAVQAVNAANWWRIGAYVGYDWSTPGFKGLYRTLLSIPPETPRLNAPIPADVRRRAAAVSPTFAKLLPIMDEDPRCAPYRREGISITGIPGEAGSYNLWSLREAVWILHDYRIASAAEFDHHCWGVVGELRSAADRGELALRWAPLSFIPPEWGQLAREVPRALPVCWDRMTRTGFEYRQPYRVSPEVQGRYDEMALRRAGLVALQRAPESGDGARPGFVRGLDRTKRAIARAWPAVSFALLAACLCGWAAAAWTLRFARHALPPAWWMLAGLVSASLSLRVLLVATLHATGVVALDRYMFPAAALLVPAGMLGLRAIIVVGSRPLRARPPHTML